MLNSESRSAPTSRSTRRRSLFVISSRRAIWTPWGAEAYAKTNGNRVVITTGIPDAAGRLSEREGEDAGDDRERAGDPSAGVGFAEQPQAEERADEDADLS